MAGAPSLTASSGSSPAAVQPSSGSRLNNIGERARRGMAIAVKHVVKHTGTGIVCSVAYFDP